MDETRRLKPEFLKFGKTALRIVAGTILGILVIGGVFYFSLTLVIVFLPIVEYLIRILTVGIPTSIFISIGCFLGSLLASYISRTKLNVSVSVLFIFLMLLFPIILVNAFILLFMVPGLILGGFFGRKLVQLQSSKLRMRNKGV
ncbi:MAG: hypothetical protein ACTSXP_13900 [Promethearchaeota archaeon]